MEEGKLYMTAEKQAGTDKLPVMEHFYTIQGEGAWTGTPAYFIRLAGCDVGCHWCDVKDSWEVAPSQYTSIDDLLKAVSTHQAQRVVLTGGEPTLYDLGPLTDRLHASGLKIHIETAGVHPLRGAIDWICFSPKKFKAPLPVFYETAHELKVVVYHPHDLTWAEMHASRCTSQVRLFLQPEWSRRERVMPLIMDYVKEHPHWRISLQTHKYLGIP